MKKISDDFCVCPMISDGEDILTCHGIKMR